MMHVLFVRKQVWRTPRVLPTLLLLAGAAFSLMLTGCGSADNETIAEGPAEEPHAQPADVPAPSIPADAPVMGATFPALSDGILQGARLVDLPDGVILQAEGVVLSPADLEAEISQAPESMQDSMQKGALFLLEQQATQRILEEHVRREKQAESVSPEMLQLFFADMLAGIEVSEADINTFYAENQKMIGDAPLEQVRSSIEQHLVQLQQQELVEAYIRELGETEPIALDKQWITTQAAMAMDNEVDQARSSGTPTFVSFGADTCIPCQKMKPFREDIAQKYGERLNVVYVHVNKQPMLASRYGVRGIPHVIFFDAKGKEAFVHTGFMPKEQLEAQIKNLGVEL